MDADILVHVWLPDGRDIFGILEADTEKYLVVRCQDEDKKISTRWRIPHSQILAVGSNVGH